MTKQFRVVLALKALAAAAFPAADVRGFDKDTAKPGRIGSGGCVIGHPGEPGEPEVDLSPLSYNYQHRLVVELAAPQGAGGAALDAMIETLATATAADPHLGGLCDYLSVEAPDRNDRTTDTIATTNWATIGIIAEYATDSRLG